MQIEEIKHVFASQGDYIINITGTNYYRVGGKPRQRSLRSLDRQAQAIVKKQQKAARKLKSYQKEAVESVLSGYKQSRDRSRRGVA